MNVYVIAIVVAIVIFIQHIRKRSRHPPGPLGLPFVGMFPVLFLQLIFEKFLPKVPHLKFSKQMKQKYGEIWSIEMGGSRVVSLSSIDVVNEAFLNNGHLFSGRPINDVYNIMCGRKGVLLSNFDVWKNNRKRALKALREFEMGKNHAPNEANLFIEHLKKVSEHPFDGLSCFFEPISNVMTVLVFNKRYNYGDPEFKNTLTRFKLALHSNALNTICTYLPSFSATRLGRFLFPGANKLIQSWVNNRQFDYEKYKKIIENENDEPSCIFEYFWRYQYQDRSDISQETKLKDTYHLASDLYLAGVETSSTLLCFLCLMLGRYPDIQNDLRSEIQNITDDYKQLDMHVRKDLPKLLSFIDEVNRFCCTFPNVPRKVMETCMFRGYKLYPDDIILGNWGAICRDETLFENPDLFDPHRFMDKTRTRYIASKYMIPLGIGKRACIGENFISMIIFLILSRMILTFEISLTSETERNFENILEGTIGFVHAPLAHNFNFRLLHRD